MTTHERRARFAEDVSLVFEAWGLSPMAGRVWAALLVTDQPHLSAADLQEQIGASAGSISTAVAALARLGIVERVWVPGDRRSYYAASMTTLERLVERRAEAMSQMAALSGQGAEAFKDVEPARERLEQLRDFYLWFERELEVVLERWRQEQRASKNETSQA